MPRPDRSSPGPSRSLPTVEETSAGGLVVDGLPDLPLRNGALVDGTGTDGTGTDDRQRRAASPVVAVIARLNRAGRVEWCLPKGHPEAGETLEQAAVREIEEETGIHGEILAALGSIDYWFSADGYRIHKHVHHFLLRATGGRLSVDGDPDAEAIDVAWVPLAEVGARLAFPNERRIAEQAAQRLADPA